MAGIRVRSVGKAFGTVQVLRDVSLDIEPAEFVALVGPSGCGKTTLMRIIAGLETADTGSIEIADRDVTDKRGADRDVAMVFQNYALYPHLTVRQNLAVPLVMRRLTSLERLPIAGPLVPGRAAKLAEIAAEGRQVASMLGIEHLLDRRPGQLSGGQRQRVALGRAIVRHPAAFLMDEPLSNLDAALRVHTRKEIVDLHRRVGASTVYVTHDQSEAMTMADRVAVMMDGSLLQVGTPEAVYGDPQDIRVASFLGSPKINTIAAEVDAVGVVRIAGHDTGLRAAPRLGPVTLAVRAEDCRLDAREGLPAKVEHAEFLGDAVLVHLKLVDAGDAVIIRVSPTDRRPIGETVNLRPEPSRAFLFDVAGRRVASQPATQQAQVAHG